MLFRLVRPVKRKGSRHHQFVRRIPSAVKARTAGLKLAIPVGDETVSIVLSKRTQAVRLSLRTSEPAEVKSRLAAVDAYLENVWRALRESAAVSLTHKHATALGGELYRAWVNGEGREYKSAIEHDPEFANPEGHILVRGPEGQIEFSAWRRINAPHISADEWEAARAHLEKLRESGNSSDIEKRFGPLLDRLLLSKGIGKVDELTRAVVFESLLLALADAFEQRRRNAEGDYSPDPKSQRFPEWETPGANKSAGPKVSLKRLLEKWCVEAQATGRKPSTLESYTNSMLAFIALLGHDDAARATRRDVVAFKDHRLATTNPRSGKPISPKTVKDSDLSGLKAIFGWAKSNGLIESNPAEGVTIKIGKQRKLRSKGLTDSEAAAILGAALRLKPGNERPKTFEAKRWVPWLCAYTGARVGELLQLRKEDVRREGRRWTLTITPDAGTVKTNEARQVVLHPHLVDLGFTAFVGRAPAGHLFLTPASNGDVLGPLQGLKNRLAEFARTIISDKNVAPNHGWRHRFKTVGIEARIEHRILDAIQGQRPRNVAEGYGEVSIKAQARAIAKIPRYKVGPR